VRAVTPLGYAGRPPAVTAPPRRGCPVGRAGRLERALRRWDAWETNARLPEAGRRPMAEPVLDREALAGLHQMLSEELACLDGARRPAG
jgi:hypothetical protein